MLSFQTQTPNVCKLWWVYQWKMLVYIFSGHLAYFMAIWHILWPFGIFYGHLAYFMAIWYIFPCFGMLYQEKSGNPGQLGVYLHKQRFSCRSMSHNAARLN
jgi:hypothetical protein